MYKRVCRTCGTPFESEYRNRQYCTQECAAMAQEKQRKQRERRLLEEGIIANGKSKDIYRIAKLAAAAGMSYGEYVQAHNV